MGKIMKFSDRIGKWGAQLNELEKKSPRLRLYVEVKRRHLKTILFYRMGDFYETFLDDAIAVSRVLDVGITSRGLPMCGFPFHDASRHLRKMLKAGYRLATCETVEDKNSPSGFRHIVTRRRPQGIIIPFPSKSRSNTKDDLLTISEQQ